jgi:hypothetical protein
MQAQDKGTVAASHYTRHIKETSTGDTITSMEEEKETKRRGNAPHHRNWQQKVNTVTSRTDNGAVHTFDRTDATGESEVIRSDWMAHHHRLFYKQAAREGKKSPTASTAVVHTIQVTDVGSETMVGCFSHRNANITLLATIDEELTEAVLTVAKKDNNGPCQEQHREQGGKKVLHAYNCQNQNGQSSRPS